MTFGWLTDRPRRLLWRRLLGRRLLWRLVCLVGLLPAACSLGDSINRDAFDYFQVNDLASNQIILLNVLYAKYGAPLHFSELSQIRGQLTTTASASSTFPFGPIDHATVNPRALATTGISVSSAPSFDISSLDTKDFTTGVMTTITPQTLEFFLNEGVDYRMVLMLLASGIRPAGTPEMVLNAPNDSRKVCVNGQHTANSNAPLSSYQIMAAGEACATSLPEFFAFLDVLNQLHRIYPVAVAKPPMPVGPPFSLSMNANLRAITSIDPTKYTLRRLPSGQYQLMTAARTSMIVLCEEMSPSARVVSVLSGSVGAATRVRKDACTTHRTFEDDAAEGVVPPATDMVTVGADPNTFALQLRSTLEVIQYVGQILAFQDAETASNPQFPERCVTLGFIQYDANHATCGGAVLIHLQDVSGLFPPGLTVSYDGRRWMLPQSRTCADSEHCDYSSQTLSIISLLLNQNKSASEIAKTPAVQVVP